MAQEKVSIMGGGLLWFGAAISIAEIITGALLGPLGLPMGILAIIVGHIVGCILFYFVGLIGGKSRLGAMESTKITFGRYGSIFFSLLNILQLVGWTAVMITNGAQAMNRAVGADNSWVWCLVIGGLIAVWIIVGLKNLGKINVFAVGALLILTVVLGITVFKGGTGASWNQGMSFGLALELSIAMPISWLPLISDYTKDSDSPVAFTFVSTICYFLGSCFMYIIGLAAAIFAQTSDIAMILTSAGLGIVAIIIIILSTVTTTFLDVYSAGESTVNIWKKLNPKVVGVMFAAIGTAIPIFVPILQYENFLYLIGSVFVPMATIMIADYFVIKNTEFSGKINLINSILWVIGFILYRVFLNVDTAIGSTIPTIIIIFALCLIRWRLLKKPIENIIKRR